MIFYSLNNISKLPQYKLLSDEIKEAINIVGTILPFRVNNYVAENLIDWNNIPLDPIFRLTFMDKGMLKDDQYERMKRILNTNHSTKTDIMETANSIRRELNPHPIQQHPKLTKAHGTVPVLVHFSKPPAQAQPPPVPRRDHGRGR